MSGATQATILDALAGRLATDPDGPYLDFDGVALTAREMERAANRAANGLAGLGVGRGDRVATLLENSAEQVISFFAALKLGAIQVPINTAYKGEFLRHVLADCGARVVVTQASLAARVAEVCGDPAGRESLPELRAVVVVGPTDGVDIGIAAEDWESLLAAGSDAPPADVEVGPSDLACFIY